MLLHSSRAMLGRLCFSPPPDAWEWTERVKCFIILLVYRDSAIAIMRDWHLVYFCNPLLFVCWKQRKYAKTTSNLSWWIMSFSGLVIFVLHVMVKYWATLYIVIHYWKFSFRFLSFSTLPLCLKSLIPLLLLQKKSWVNRHLDNC